MYGVFRVLKDGNHRYVTMSCTSNKKLAEEIAADLSAGTITMPDGSLREVTPIPHIAKELGR